MPATDDPFDIPGLDGQLKDLARQGQLRRYRKNTLIIQEGDRGETLFVILAGRLRAFSANAEGREITFGVYGPGEYLGEMSLDGGPRSANVVTLEPSICSVIDRATIESFISVQPGFAFELLGKVIRRARAATVTARQLALNDVYGRLRECLLSMSHPTSDACVRVVGERLTHQTLAARLGCSREMVSRLMKDLERGGYITVEPARLVVRQPLPTRW